MKKKNIYIYKTFLNIGKPTKQVNSSATLKLASVQLLWIRISSG